MTNRGPRNEELLQAIARLEKASRKQKKMLWKKVAEKLQKPSRKRVSVNIWKINAVGKKLRKKFLLVPGKVLSFGELEHPANVIAFDFSAEAKNKINKKGKALTISEALEANIKPGEIAIVC